MTTLDQNYTLSHQIKTVIQTFYKDLPQKQLAEKVRTEIIPILITLFFENISLKSSKKIFGSESQIANCMQSALLGKQNVDKSSGNLSQKNQKYVLQVGNIRKYRQRNPSRDEQDLLVNIQKFIEGKDLPAQDLIRKTLAICKLFACASNLKQNNQNCAQLYRIYREEKTKKVKLIKWLNIFIQFSNKKQIIYKFYRNLSHSKSKLEGLKALHKLYILKLHKYYTNFITILVGSQLHTEQFQNQKWEKIKSNMIQRGLNKLHQFYNSNMRAGISKIIKQAKFKNPWRETCIRCLVFKTPANLQTSLWRLQNFAKNSQKQLEIQQEKQQLHILQIKKQNIDSRSAAVVSLTSIKKQQKSHCDTRKILQDMQNAQSKEQIQAILFTKQQKAQILWEQLQQFYELLSVGTLIQAFSTLDLYQSNKREKIKQVPNQVNTLQLKQQSEQVKKQLNVILNDIVAKQTE